MKRTPLATQEERANEFLAALIQGAEDLRLPELPDLLRKLPPKAVVSLLDSAALPITGESLRSLRASELYGGEAAKVVNERLRTLKPRDWKAWAAEVAKRMGGRK